MALTNCYVTFEEIRDRLRMTGTADIAGVEVAITSACRGIDEWCGQQFYQDSGTSVRTYEPNSAASLSCDPISTTSGLVIKTDSADDAAYATTWASTDYELEPFGGFGRYASAPYDTIHAVGSYYFPTGNRRRASVQVTARWGWATTPTVVKEAARILSVDLWKRRDTPFGIATQSMEFGGLRIGRDLYAQVASLLQPYRRANRVMGFA